MNSLVAAMTELATPMAKKAWWYVRTWDRLRAAGVGAGDLRCAMDMTPRRTQILARVEAWEDAGEQGCLVLRSAPGPGKTFAAIRWAMSRARRGFDTHWLEAARWGGMSWDEITTAIGLSEHSSALVIDDLGQGASDSEKCKERVRGVLIARHADGLPSLVISNATSAELESWLGSAMLDRLSAIGDMLDVDAKSLRSGPGVPPARPGVAYSSEYVRATALIELLGVRFDGGAWEIGGSLRREAVPRVRELVGVSHDELLARARQIEARDQEIAREFGVQDPRGFELSFAHAMTVALERMRGSQCMHRERPREQRADRELDDAALAERKKMLRRQIAELRLEEAAGREAAGMED